MRKKVLFSFVGIAFIILSTLCIIPTRASASTTKANISLGDFVEGSKFEAKETIEILFTINKYSTSDFGSYYCEIRDEKGKTVANSQGSISDLDVGTTNLTLFWDYKGDPHELGKYTVRYYTSNDTGGSTYFYISTISGEVNSKISWKINDSGELTISGSGNMNNYERSSDVPWYSQKAIVTKVEIGKGITSIGDRCFYGFINLSEISIPSSLKKIGEYAFYDCNNLELISLPKSLTSIGDYAFDDSGLEKIKFEGSEVKWKKIVSTYSHVPKNCKLVFSKKAPKLSKMKFTSAKKTKSHTVTLKWSKQSGVDGYEIQYVDCDDNIEEYNKKIKVKKSLTQKSINNMWGEASFRIRSYKKFDGGYVYSPWSKIVTVEFEGL